ncbi:MAG TPA: hypothetical protein PKM73_00405 [Verrucomicrobiota bacterium]|nr:hypothetical protein [Verrucomicrobiota bacterium]HNU49503.1 hypothetical protein [Verrucomicrobiota bacterium]
MKGNEALRVAEGEGDRLDRELKRLPDRCAPASLIPRVLAAIRERERLPWYRRPFTGWPGPMRLVVLAGLVGLLGVATWALVEVVWGWNWGERFPEWAGCATVVRAVWSAADSLAGALVVVVRQAGGWVLGASLLLAGTMYLSCVGLGTAAFRLATAVNGRWDHEKHA